jgi:hypothetical protein
MGTLVNAVQATSLRSEQPRQSPVDRLYRFRREVAPSDPGLVADHNRRDARLIQETDGLRCAGDQAQAVRIV